MYRFRLVILIFIAIIWFVIVLPYFLLQTHFGAGYASDLMSNYSGKQITIGQISHSFASPYELIFEDVSIKENDQSTAILTAKKLVVRLDPHNLLQTEFFNYLLVENGEILISQLPATKISANLLQLKNIALHYTNAEQDIDIALYNTYGGIKYWSTQPAADTIQNQFNLTAKQSTYNRLGVQSLYLQGFQKDHRFNINNIGGNINQGFFTGQFTVDKDYSLIIQQLKLNKLNIQTTIDSLDIHELFSRFSRLTVENISIINSSFSSPSITIEKANFEGENFVYEQTWQLQKSKLAFNAQSIVWQDELISEPLLQWQSEEDKIVLKQMMAKWNKGHFQAHGYLQNEQLVLENVIAGGIQYQLPEEWYQKLITLQLPDCLQKVSINHAMLLPSVVIDTNPQFSFQFSGFEALINGLNLTKQNNNIESFGEIQLKADSATLNTIALINPDLTLLLTSVGNTAAFSALVDKGIIDGTAKIKDNNQKVELKLNSYFVDSYILSAWDLVKNPPKSQKFVAKLAGDIANMKLAGDLVIDNKSYPIVDNNILAH